LLSRGIPTLEAQTVAFQRHPTLEVQAVSF